MAKFWDAVKAMEERIEHGIRAAELGVREMVQPGGLQPPPMPPDAIPLQPLFDRHSMPPPEPPHSPPPHPHPTTPKPEVPLVHPVELAAGRGHDKGMEL